MDLLKQVSYAKFNGTVEVHFHLGVDPRHADQQVRSTVLLPAGLGKTVRILVFAEGDGARLAEQAGADFVGLDDMIAKIQGGWLDFDMAIATPQVMGKVGRLGRILGTRGLMPNPKAGTIVQPDDLPRAIREARQGRVEFKVDKTGNLHVPIGKVEFTPAADPGQPVGPDGRGQPGQAHRRQGHLHQARDADQHHGARHPPGHPGSIGHEATRRLSTRRTAHFTTEIRSNR